MAKGFDFSVGFRRQELSFIYVEDLARAIFDALAKAPAGEIYNIAEPRGYTQKEFRRLAMKEMGKRFVVPMRMPLDGQGSLGSGREMGRGPDETFDAQPRQIQHNETA